MDNSPTTASCGSLIMMGSYGGVHQHQHHTDNVSSMDSNNTQMMSTIHPYHFQQQNDNPNHTTATATLPPLPSPLGGAAAVGVVGCDVGAGAGSGSGCNNNQFMIWDNYYQSKQQPHHHHFVNINNDTATQPGDTCSTIKAKIMAHPHYPRLLTAYVNCQKVGAPPEVVGRLEEACSAAVGCLRRGGSGGGAGVTGMGAEVGEDPSLDQFMEAYCEMLSKYEQELTKPFKEAMVFLSRIESQFKSLSLSSSSSADSSTAFGEANDRNGSSEEEIDVNASAVDPLAEDRELKFQLLRKYSGYLGSLKQEFMKKRKKGKLPKEARQQLLEWWTRHYKWPYPSESQKLALAEATGLDQKQINNWFINQRKRHWKPSEDMQFVVMDATASHHQHHPHYYMDNVLGNPYTMDISSALL